MDSTLIFTELMEQIIDNIALAHEIAFDLDTEFYTSDAERELIAALDSIIAIYEEAADA